MATLRLGPAEQETLRAGAARLGVELDHAHVARLTEFAALLDSWSRRTNLISCGTGRELVERHLLDSLVLAPHLDGAGSAVDLGSGAGLPGLPLAIAGGGLAVVLVESRRRRASFLRAVRRELGLDRVTVLEQRAEDGPPADMAGAARVVCRAVWPDARILPIAAQWLRPEGRLLWMRSGRATAVRDSEAELTPATVETYRLGSGPARTIHVFERR